MIKFLISGAAAFVLALGAGTLVPVMLTPVRPAPAPASAAGPRARLPLLHRPAAEVR